MMTARILDGAYDRLLLFGLRATTVEDVARHLGIARITIYRRFANRDDLIRAVLVREGERIFEQVGAAVAHLPKVDDQLVEGFVAILAGVRNHPLVTRVLATEPDIALPLATLNAGPIIATARDYLAGHLQRARAAPVAELAVRLTLSYLLTPDSCIPLETDDDARRFARRYLLPLLRTP